MPRPPRLVLPNDVCHVVARGVDGQAIYRDDADRTRFLRLLDRAIRQFAWRCLTYCLMGNHYHLVIQLRTPNLSSGIQRLNGDYVSAFNERHERDGHLFERRFWSKRVREDAHMVGLLRYVALNPVRSGLCPTAERWAWSAHRALIGSEGPRFVDVATAMSHLDADLDRARRQYVSLVSDADPPRHRAIDVQLAETLAWADPVAAVAHAHDDLGYPVSQIAAAFGCTPRTVRNRLAAAAAREREKGV